MIEYNGSLIHQENARLAWKIGREKLFLQKEKRIEQYNQNPAICKQCLQPMPYKKRGNKFCSSSCAASFNNLGKIKSSETKAKIGLALHNLPKKEKPIFMYVCKCGIHFSSTKNNRVYCSGKCASVYNGTTEITRKRLSDKMKENVKSGNFIGWKSRKGKEASYPEKYFISLFENENIEGWERDKKAGRWFIDFAFVNKMIALEVDGSQHKYRKEKDAEKDKFLIENGWKVIRIDWFNPVNTSNKEKLYSQIEKFKNILYEI